MADDLALPLIQQPSKRPISSARIVLRYKQLDKAGHLNSCNDDSLPAYIYSYQQGRDKLWRTDLVTGEESCYEVPSYQFRSGCCCSQSSEGSLLITGGGWPLTREVVKIDPLREFAVSQQPPMLTPRAGHACVHHGQLLYVLGGYTSSSSLSECERYAFAESRWEALPPLPTAACGISGVVAEGSLYALGGISHGRALDLIQKLSLDDLTWECLTLRLPQAGHCIPCFKVSGTVYLVMCSRLYSLADLQVPLKSLQAEIQSWRGPSYYSKQTLYCSNHNGAALRLEILLSNGP